MFNQKVSRISENDPWEYSPVKYWPSATGDALSFYAYAPYTTVVNNTTATIAIDGDDDILWARAIRTTEGQTTTEVDSGTPVSYADGKGGIDFVFKHVLQRLSFRFIQGDGFGDQYYIDRLTIQGLHNSVDLDVRTGDIADGNSVSNFILGGGRNSYLIDDPSLVKTVADVMYVSPGTSELDIKLSILGIEYGVKVPLTDYGSGKSYLIQLTFNGTEIKPSITFTTWGSLGFDTGIVID